MTKQGYTACVFIVDNSGSMWSIKDDMEGAIKSLLESQQKLPGTLTVDLTNFSTTSRDQFVLAAAEDVNIQISPSGGTALYDAVGKKVASFGTLLAELPEDERPEQVIVAIVTDGYENSSREYTSSAVEKVVTHQTNKYGWNFVYLGANQDAVLTARTMGIAAGSALTYNTENVAVAGATMDSYMTATRSGIANYSFSDKDREKNA